MIVKLFGLLNFISGILALILGLYVLRKGKKKDDIFLLLLFISAAWWNLSLSFENISGTLTGHIFWSAFSYVGNMFAPVLLFLFLYHYTHFNGSLPKPVIAVILIIPTLSNLFVWHPKLRTIVWSEITLNPTPWGLIAQLEHGWWYYVEAYSSYILVGLGIYYLIRGLSLFPREYSKQVRLLLLASLVPLLLNFIYTLNNKRFYGLDLTSVAFTLSLSIFYYIITKYQLLNATPIAWNTIVENIREGVMVCVNDKITSLNPTAKEILKTFGAEGKEGVPVLELMKEKREFIDFYNNPLVEKIDLNLGDQFYEVSKNPITDKKGFKPSLIIIFHDITEIKKKETEIQSINQQLMESNVTKDMLFKVVSHDLRGSIGTIAAYLGHIVENDKTVEKKKLEVLYNTAADASFLIENLLYWAISQGNDLKIHPSRHLISDTVSRAIDSLHFHANQKEIALKNNCLPEIAAIYDAQSIEIVIRNLLSNSIKYSFPKCEIEIKSNSDSQFTYLQITDSGIGFSEETIRKIMSDIAVKSERGTMHEIGTGIGLTLCLKMVRTNKGTMEISSKPGKGSTVTIALPS